MHDLTLWSGAHRGLRDWIRQRLQRLFASETCVDPPIACEVTPSAPAAPKSELAQFPDLVFGAHGVDLDDRAEQNDAAIRAGLIWFKHRWPGEMAEIDGSEAFRRKAWQMADEVGVAIKGPRPVRGDLARHRSG